MLDILIKDNEIDVNGEILFESYKLWNAMFESYKL